MCKSLFSHLLVLTFGLPRYSLLANHFRRAHDSTSVGYSEQVSRFILAPLPASCKSRISTNTCLALREPIKSDSTMDIRANSVRFDPGPHLPYHFEIEHKRVEHNA